MLSRFSLNSRTKHRIRVYWYDFKRWLKRGKNRIQGVQSIKLDIPPNIHTRGK